MVWLVLIALFSLIALITLHELGHFITAKRFGVKVDEFGIGFPPRIFGKKIGETVYSLNLLPLGAFVKMPGEIGVTDDPRSFSSQAVWKRILIALAGVVSFWIMAAIIFSLVAGIWGLPIAVNDQDTQGLVNPEVRIAEVANDSPAQLAGLQVGDTVKQMVIDNQSFPVTTVTEVQSLTNANLGKEITFAIQRSDQTFDLVITPRVSPPSGQGPLGVGLVRTALKSYPWYSAPWTGITTTVGTTWSIIQGYGQVINNLVHGQPTGVELRGPVGVVDLFTQASKLGIGYFLQFVGIVAIYIAIFNILPIPAVDGGKILFLLIEAVRRRPISQRVEQGVTAVFFSLLVILMIFVTVKDVVRLF